VEGAFIVVGTALGAVNTAHFAQGGRDFSLVICDNLQSPSSRGWFQNGGKSMSLAHRNRDRIGRIGHHRNLFDVNSINKLIQRFVRC
jgi:hypothetical protein